MANEQFHENEGKSEKDEVQEVQEELVENEEVQELQKGPQENEVQEEKEVLKVSGNESEPKGLSYEEKQWSMFIHLSALIGYFTGLGFILAPLILWLIKKDSNSDFIDQNGKEAVNFQISVFIYGIIVSILCFILVGFLLLPVLIVGQLILMIIAGVQANEGKMYRYPLTIRFIK